MNTYGEELIMAEMLRIDRLKVEVLMSDGTTRVVEMGENDAFFRCALDLAREPREIEPEDFTSWRAFVAGDRFHLTVSATGSGATFIGPPQRAIDGS
jgi:antirestriction protein ArdC